MLKKRLNAKVDEDAEFFGMELDDAEVDNEDALKEE